VMDMVALGAAPKDEKKDDKNKDEKKDDSKSGEKKDPKAGADTRAAAAAILEKYTRRQRS
jgi:hypothetical protein